jgi:hypothetical protein
VTDAAVHDSRPLDELLIKGNTSADVFADSAYRSAEIEAKLKASGFKSRIHRRGAHDPAARGTLLRSEHMLDASADSALDARFARVCASDSGWLRLACSSWTPSGRLTRYFPTAFCSNSPAQFRTVLRSMSEG